LILRRATEIVGRAWSREVSSLFRDYSIILPEGLLSKTGRTFAVEKLGDWYQMFVETADVNELAIPSTEGGFRHPSTGLAVSEDRERVIKVEFARHRRKRNCLREEAHILRHLNETSCRSAPTLYEIGTADPSAFGDALPPSMLPAIRASGIKSVDYLVMSYVRTARSTTLPAVIGAMLEQQACGYYHADVKPENIRTVQASGEVVLIDYDQAEPLEADIASLPPREFLRWCDLRESQRYGRRYGTWRRHFFGLGQRHVERVLERSDLLERAIQVRAKGTDARIANTGSRCPPR